jgi:hypothetical protein
MFISNFALVLLWQMNILLLLILLFSGIISLFAFGSLIGHFLKLDKYLKELSEHKWKFRH